MKLRLHILVLLLCSWCTRVSAQPVANVVISGLQRTREDTVLALLPAPPPHAYSDAELLDFERRLGNLAIFDRVEVVRAGARIEVKLREKWTLIPDFALSTGKTIKDLYVAAGATEYNLFGTANQLSVSGYREQRGLGFMVAFLEHEYRRRRWAYRAAIQHGDSSARFDDGRGWYMTSTSVVLGLNSPPVVSRLLRFQLELQYQHESMDDIEGDYAPPDGDALHLRAALIWDNFFWHDLAPRGLRVSLHGGPGFFVPAAQPRHGVLGEITWALPLWKNAVLMARGQAAVSTRGNANSSWLIGSIEGVRGLEDARYRNWAQAFANVELRSAVRVLERIALQAVVFTDVGGFNQMDAFGTRGGSVFAYSLGGGARVIPTFLSNLLFRVDFAYTLAPTRSWLPILGIAQYFQ